ncbi:MAG: GTPase Era [Rickettsiales bacterium]
MTTSNNSTDKQKCGIIAIVGAPNAGKSTLLNYMIGGKLSIVTPKVQTTRFNIRGIYTHENSQLVFIDTPGIFNPDKKFEQAMVSAAWSAISDSDIVLLLIDAAKGINDGLLTIISKLKEKTDKPVCLLLNKIDAIKKSELFDLAAACDKVGNFHKIFMVSALKGSGVSDVTSYLANNIPAHPWLYPDAQISDISMRMLAAEITREKLFLRLNKEIPYSIMVETESWDEKDNSIKIAQAIYVQKEGQKKIVIGKNGAMLKAIGIASRKELEKLTDKKIHLSLFVKIKERWKDNSETYKLLGLEFKR